MFDLWRFKASGITKLKLNSLKYHYMRKLGIPLPESYLKYKEEKKQKLKERLEKTYGKKLN